MVIKLAVKNISHGRHRMLTRDLFAAANFLVRTATVYRGMGKFITVRCQVSSGCYLLKIIKIC